MKLINSRSGAPSAQASATFTGTVWQDNILPKGDNPMINTVVFTPCARTYWHYHEGGQLLQVTSGRGWVCSEGEDPVAIEAGDTVWVPAGEKHWHGGGVDTMMTHTAISLGETVWLDEVAEDVYRAAQ